MERKGREEGRKGGKEEGEYLNSIWKIN